LVVIRTVDGVSQTWYALSNAPAEVPLFQVVGVQGWRHGVEELLQAGKGKWVWATTKCAVGWAGTIT